MFEREGVKDIDMGRRSGIPKPALNKLHGRLAVAVLLDLCQEEDVHEVAERWGRPQTVFKNGWCCHESIKSHRVKRGGRI